MYVHVGLSFQGWNVYNTYLFIDFPLCDIHTYTCKLIPFFLYIYTIHILIIIIIFFLCNLFLNFSTSATSSHILLELK